MERMRIALAGDVMIGRGVDQIMAHPGDPKLYESWARSAMRYVELAEARSGPLPRRVGPEYVWGDTLARLEALDVDARIVNLETAITGRGTAWPDKGIHYRVHPANADCLVAGGVDVVSLANNHILDWSEPGLADTLDTLGDLGVSHTGVGHNHEEAWTPAVVDRLLILGVGATSSGIPSEWTAGPDRPGVALLGDLSIETVEEALGEHRRPDHLVIVSVHWGANWGYRIPPSHQRFARTLIDHAGVDVVHGHSSHHPLGFEVYHDRLILYGCGDLVSDYEGISGKDEYRPELGAWYVVDLDPGTGAARGLSLVPTKVRRFQLIIPNREELDWMAGRLGELASGVDIRVHDDVLEVSW
jgi:poly-gamma-glutamate capsule biosynthesis protein CapA/YwtB (metallophosphatase superfamily)